jgi:hypothetical protein
MAPHRVHPLILAAALLVVGAVAGTVAARSWSVQARAEAVAIGERAAKTLGLTFSEFGASTLEDNGLLGQNRYIWDRRDKGTSVESLVYDPIEGIVCWSRKSSGKWEQLGCITAG